jgi:mono/diheme cytochrome c family protein
VGRTRRLRWIATLLALSGCEPGGVAVPPDFDTPQARARGRELFLERCAICHGERADGQGPRRSSLSPPPANFRDPSWRSRTSPGRTFSIVRDGRPGTPMAAWKPVLSDAETWDLVAYLHAVGGEHPEPQP